MTISVSEAIEALIEAANNEVEEYDQMIIRIGLLELENKKLKKENAEVKGDMQSLEKVHDELCAKYKALDNASATVTGNAKKHMQMLEQSLREKDQLVDKYELLKTQLVSYKQIGTPKKIREKLKAYKSKVEDGTKAVAAAKEKVKDYSKRIKELVASAEHMRVNEVATSITSAWSENGNHLMVFPSPLTMKVQGKVEKQMTLLFMDNSGCGKLIGLDSENEPLLCTMPKGGLKPKAKTLKVAGEILRKFKRQGWKLQIDDLDLQHWE